jgi:hypothetical protein
VVLIPVLCVAWLVRHRRKIIRFQRCVRAVRPLCSRA